MKDYKAYIFDLYGTLADIHTDEERPLFWKKMTSFYRENGADYEAEELKETYLKEVKDREEKQKSPGREIEIELREVFQSLYERKGVPAGKRLIEDTAVYFRIASRDRLRLYAHVKELLEELRQRGKGVYLLSNAQEVFTMRELDDLGISECFDDIFISSSCSFKKPDPAFMRALLDKYDLKAEECLMIGNDLSSDIRTAERCGMDSYYIHTALSPKRYSKEIQKIRPVYSQEGMDIRKLKKRLLKKGKDQL